MHTAPAADPPADPDAPRVSAIMPTANRRRFVAQAIAAFLAQTERAAELVILDDGDDAVGDLIPADPRVRYVREAVPRPLGAKRNRLCDLARGAIIVHWDDDDWHAPDRLARQRAALEASGADLCGADRVTFLADDGGSAWDYRYGGPERWVCGGSLAYTRAYWQRRPFRAIGCGEDTDWVFHAADARIHVIDGADLFVARVHAGNTSPKRTDGGGYRPRDAAAVRALVADFGAACGVESRVEAAPDLTVVIPHGGTERLPLLAHTLAHLRRALPDALLIVVELGVLPYAAGIAAEAGARHLFAACNGPFERARALNLGSAAARTVYILWHDNDLVAAPGFHARAIAELEAGGLDFLIPYSAIHYCGEAETAAWLASRDDAPPATAPLRTLHASREVSGGMGLVRRAFLERHGGLDERFRGWGGEDNGWWHKAATLGRAGASIAADQTLHHLHHAQSGGSAGAAPHLANPHYQQNLAVLADLAQATTEDDWRRHRQAGSIATMPPPPLHVPVFLYWEGPCPAWILRCRETILRHGGDVRLLDRAAFEALRTDDRDIDLDPLLPAHRADYVRAYLLARQGGIWIDSDCLLMAPLDGVRAALASHGFVAHRDRQGYYPNGFIAAAPGNPLAAALYDAVAVRLRSGAPRSWISLGGEPLTELLQGAGGRFHELPCTAIQPVCWSDPARFFRRAEPAEHAAAIDPHALTYMLSNTQITAYAAANPAADLLAPDSFFRFVLDRSLARPVDRAPALPEAGAARTTRSVFAHFHADASRRGDESLSGPGSSLVQTAGLREALPALLRDLGIATLLDVGCGDHHWLQATALPVDAYIGVDVVPDLVARNGSRDLPGRRFLTLDAVTDALPAADLVLMRDVLVHYDHATARALLANLRRSGARWLLATTFTARCGNPDGAPGGWRPLNLVRPPFAFPAPMRLLHEGCTEGGGAYADKSLGLWQFADLPI